MTIQVNKRIKKVI